MAIPEDLSFNKVFWASTHFYFFLFSHTIPLVLFQLSLRLLQIKLSSPMVSISRRKWLSPSRCPPVDPQFFPLTLAFILWVSHSPIVLIQHHQSPFWAQSVSDPRVGLYVVHCGAYVVHFRGSSWPFSQLFTSRYRKEVGSSRCFSLVGVYRGMLRFRALGFDLIISSSSELGIVHHFFSWTPYSSRNILSKFQNFSQQARLVPKIFSLGRIH